MDISTLDLKELKALAYDALLNMKLNESNLQKIELQIQKLQEVKNEDNSGKDS